MLQKCQTLWHTEEQYGVHASQEQVTMSDMIKGIDPSAAYLNPNAQLNALKRRESGERAIQPSEAAQSAKLSGAQLSNALERFQDKVQTTSIHEPPKRAELESPLELISVKVLAELKEGFEIIAPHEPRDHLITITLKALSTDGIEAQVTRVSSAGVATDLDLIGEGPEADRFRINGAPIRNSRAEDDPLSYEAPAQSAIAKAAAINEASAETGARAVALPTRTDLQGALNQELGAEVYGNLHPVRGFNPQRDARLLINGVDTQLGIYADRDQTGALLATLNAVSDETGVIASLNERGELVLEAPDGRNISVRYDGARAEPFERALGLRASGAYPYGGRIAMVSFRELSLDLGRDVNYSLGDIAGDFSVMDETYYSS